MNRALTSTAWVGQLGRILGLASLLVSFSAFGQLTTIDLTFSNTPSAGSHFPWVEDGYVVAGLATFSSVWHGNTNSEPDVWAAPIGSSPYDGMLSFSSGITLATSVIITNNAQTPFDLLALDLELLDFQLHAATNIARIISSAGGIYDLVMTDVGHTINFQGSLWQKLGSVVIEFQSAGGAAVPGIGPGLYIDNIVLQSNAVPEPSSVGMGALTIFALAFMRRRARLPSGGRLAWEQIPLPDTIPIQHL